MVLHQYYFNKAEIKYISSVVPALLVVGWHIVVQHKKELVDIYDQPMCNYFRKMGNGSNMSEYTDYDIWDWYSTYYGQDFPEKAAADSIFIYVSPFLLLIGTVGNILSVIILQKLSHKVLSTCLYLSVLALVDLVVLYTRCGNEWLLHLANLDISQKLMVYSESICKVYPFVFNFLFHLSRWLIVAAALEGFISVKYPERLESLCNLDRARAVILLLTVLLVCVNMHFFWSYELVPVDDLQIPQLFCTFAKYGHQHSEEFQNIIWPMFDIIISDVLPYIIVIVCSVVMTIQICRGRHMGQRAFRDWQEKYTLDSAAINQSKITILIAAYFFIFLTLPKFGYGIFKYLMDSHGILEYSFELDAKITLADAVVTMLEYFCLSCKFFVYAASSRRFRFEVITLFQCVPACRRLKFRLQKSNSSTRPLMTDCSATLNSNCSEQMPQSQTLDFQTSIITSL